MSNRKKRAADGYSNPLAGLGDASALLSGGTYERAAPLTPSLLTALYRESWLAKRIIDMPCEDMTRGWYTLAGALPPQRAEDLRRLEARHESRREITSAIRWARLYGGACALMVLRGQERRLAEPLDPEEILSGGFSGPAGPGPGRRRGALRGDRAESGRPGFRVSGVLRL